MGAYINSVLHNNETVVYETKLHWKIYILSILFLPIAGIGILFFPFAFIARKTNEFAVTNKRIISKSGLISRKAYDILLRKVESVYVEQGIIGRTLNYGKVIVRGAGSVQEYNGITDPLTFKRIVDELIENQ